MRVPFGVVGIIYEARPNVTADAGGLPQVRQRGAAPRLLLGRRVQHRDRRGTPAGGSAVADLPADAVQLIPGPREVTADLMAARGLVDVLIPRGGAGLIDTVAATARCP